jgi:hypothetical protein
LALSAFENRPALQAAAMRPAVKLFRSCSAERQGHSRRLLALTTAIALAARAHGGFRNED